MQPVDLTDGEVIERVRSGDVLLFSALVERYQRPLIALAVNRLGRSDLAEDAVQEAFLCAYRWLDSYDSKFAFRTWLWTILLNQCRRIGERERRVEQLRNGLTDSGTETNVDRSDCPSSRLESLESDRALRKALNRLPEAHADAVRLRYFGELKFDAIAQAMGCSLRTAKYRVKEGLMKLGELLRGGTEAAQQRNAKVGADKPKSEVEHALR